MYKQPAEHGHSRLSVLEYHNTHGGQHRHNAASIPHNKKAWSRLLAATKLLDREGGGGEGGGGEGEGAGEGGREFSRA